MTEEQKKKCAELWIEHEAEMKRACRARLHGCESEIEDIIGDLYLAFCKQIDKNGYPDNSRAWLYATLDHLIKYFFRKKYRREKYTSDIRIEDIDLPSQYDFVDTLEKNECLKEIEKFIPTLSKDEQIMLKKAYFPERRIKIKEIAEDFGISEPAAKQKKYRIRDKFKKLLENF